MVPGGGKYPTTPPLKICPKPQKCPFRKSFYVFIIAGLEPKLFVFKPSTHQQICKAHKICQFCQQGQPSMKLGLKVRDRTNA